MPDIALTAVPGRRRTTVDLAKEIERRDFGGVYCPSFGDGIGLCEAVALENTTLRMGTSIANIYVRHPFDYAQSASSIHEVSGGRFTFGIGVSHGPTHEAMGTKTGKPLADTRRFVEALRAAEPRTGPLPPLVQAARRRGWPGAVRPRPRRRRRRTHRQRPQRRVGRDSGAAG
jgi:alkanesulfonate monooxygenase SsuD/methylene tetrahydromethanopterin reductase-like flavin-dependent oxidoreductase (luciferase family)